MSKSIMHDKRDGTCYLCMLLHQDEDRRSRLEEHHVMGGKPNRKLSERHGLKVYLCIQHHREGPEAVHVNAEVSRMLQRKAQEAFEKKFPELRFRDIFGKNLLETDQTEEPAGQQSSESREGIQFIKNGVEGMDWT